MYTKLIIIIDAISIITIKNIILFADLVILLFLTNCKYINDKLSLALSSKYILYFLASPVANTLGTLVFKSLSPLISVTIDW